MMSGLGKPLHQSEIKSIITKEESLIAIIHNCDFFHYKVGAFLMHFSHPTKPQPRFDYSPSSSVWIGEKLLGDFRAVALAADYSYIPLNRSHSHR